MSQSIILSGVGKHFHRYHPSRPFTLKETFIKGFLKLSPVERVWALRDVTFSVESGKMVGVIGNNGAGKSTLLRLIGGVGRPDEGTLKVNGNIGAILDLGSSFHPDLTGRENLYVSAIIGGLTRNEVKRQFHNIVEFAELEESIDNPLRTYSTGMQMRLAFAICVHSMPEVLLIDEALTVGDMGFQKKCLERLTNFKEQGCTIFLITHDMALIKQLCDEVVWLHCGSLVNQGKPELIVGQYMEAMRKETHRRTPPSRSPIQTSMGTELHVNKNRFGSLELEIISVKLTDSNGLPITELESSGALLVEIRYCAPQPIQAPIFGISISREDGLICYDINTASSGKVLPTIKGTGEITIHLDQLNLAGGKYFVNVGIFERDWAYAYDFHWHVYPLIIGPTGGGKGLLCVPHRWEISKTLAAY